MRSFRYLSAALLAGAALAAGDAPGKPEYFTAAQVDAARATGETGTALIANGEFKVLASRRDKAGQSEVHATDTDIFIVVDGSATIVIGGKLVDAREVS